jgi:hypothetical protein
MRQNHCNSIIIIIIIIYLARLCDCSFRLSRRVEASPMTGVSVPTLPVLQPRVGPLAPCLEKPLESSRYLGRFSETVRFRGGPLHR